MTANFSSSEDFYQICRNTHSDWTYFQVTASHFSFAFSFCLAMPRSYFGTSQAVQGTLVYLYVIVRSFLFFFTTKNVL